MAILATQLTAGGVPEAVSVRIKERLGLVPDGDALRRIRDAEESESGFQEWTLPVTNAVNATLASMGEMDHRLVGDSGLRGIEATWDSYDAFKAGMKDFGRDCIFTTSLKSGGKRKIEGDVEPVPRCLFSHPVCIAHMYSTYVTQEEGPPSHHMYSTHVTQEEARLHHITCIAHMSHKRSEGEFGVRRCLFSHHVCIECITLQHDLNA